MRGPAKLASYIAIGMILGGFALIWLAWNGAAGLNPSRLAGQFPYLLSGGLGGLGLIGAGAGLLFVQVQRELDAQEAHQYERVVDTMRQTVAALRGGAPVPAAAPAPAGSASHTVRVVTQPAVPPPASGEDPTVVSDQGWAPEPAEALVVVGRSSFHDASCHLVSSRDDLELMDRDEAVDAGLRPCRVCKP